MKPANIAARAGRWSAHHRRIAILGWIAFVVAATIGGGLIGTNSLAPAEMGNGSSRAADLAVDGAGFRESSEEQILLQARARAASRADLQRAAGELAERLSRVPHVEKVVSTFEMGVGLAAAILIDATIVRAVLLPAAMKLLCDWNWCLPRGLSWLPKTGAVATQRA